MHPLTRTKLSLVLIALALSTAGADTRFWPLLGWTMYRNAGLSAPSTTVSDTELRVLDRAGEMRRIGLSQVLSLEWNKLARRVADSACSPTSSLFRDQRQAYLARAVARHLDGTEIEAIECWRLHWNVEPSALPPFDRAKPTREEMVGRFNVRPGPRQPGSAP